MVKTSFRQLGALCLEQFWSTLGPDGERNVLALAQKMDRIDSISLAYCAGCNDKLVQSLLQVFVDKRFPLRSLNLFYLGQLTDATIIYAASHFPDLTELNVGRCMLITDRSMRELAKLKHLKKLNVVRAPAPRVATAYVSRVHRFTIRTSATRRSWRWTTRIRSRLSSSSTFRTATRT